MSLIDPHHFDRIHLDTDVYPQPREDDEAHLTAHMARSGSGLDSPAGSYSSGDPEFGDSTTPRSRTRTIRYSVTPSPLKKTESAMKSVGRNIRRMSLRVVNLANTGLEGQLRLGDGDEKTEKMLGDDDDGPPVPDLRQVMPLRGRALGIFGSNSKVRLALYKFLVYP